MCSFIHEAGGRSCAEKDIPNMDKKLQLCCLKTVVFTEIQKPLETWTLNMDMLDCDNIWFSFVFQVISR